MQINNHFLSGKDVENYTTTKRSRKGNKRRFIVVHYTASDNFQEDVRTLSSSPKQVSCHIVIGRDGKVAQIGDFDDVLWHAGASNWKGVEGLNGYSIGIELTNPGWMEIVEPGKVYRTYYGKLYTAERDGQITEARHPALGSKLYGWLNYSERQLTALIEVIDTLKYKYHGEFEEVVGHEQISPGRKQDPGIGIILPRKLMDKFNDIGSTDDSFYEGKDPIAESNKTKISKDKTIVKVNTSGSALRIRADHSATSVVVGSVNNGSILEVLGTYPGWVKIANGWISAAYVI